MKLPGILLLTSSMAALPFFADISADRPLIIAHRGASHGHAAQGDGFSDVREAGTHLRTNRNWILQLAGCPGRRGARDYR